MGTIIGFSIFSALLLFGFMAAGVVRFGLQPSYSDYSRFWENAVPINNMNLWSIVTCVAAFLICPALLELGTASIWQFLGFLVPVYLIVVTLTPDWYKNRKQFIVHTISAILCSIGAFLWCLFVMEAWVVLLLVAAFIFIVAIASGTGRSSLVFWLELFMFLSVYIVVFLALL